MIKVRNQLEHCWQFTHPNEIIFSWCTWISWWKKKYNDVSDGASLSPRIISCITRSHMKLSSNGHRQLGVQEIRSLEKPAKTDRNSHRFGFGSVWLAILVLCYKTSFSITFRFDEASYRPSRRTTKANNDMYKQIWIIINQYSLMGLFSVGYTHWLGFEP